MRGYFGIGIIHGKTEENIGTLLRSAHNFGAAFVFTVEGRYHRQPTDTTKAHLSIPLFYFDSLADLRAHMPQGAALIGVEQDQRARDLPGYCHPEQAVYLLGGEDCGLTEDDRRDCDSIVQVPGTKYCLNVASAGSIVLYDRMAKAR